MESKFLDKDVDLVFPANKVKLLDALLARPYNKNFKETVKLTENFRITKMGSDLVLTECLVVGFCVLQHHLST